MELARYENCDAGSFWSRARSGSSDLSGIILEEAKSPTTRLRTDAEDDEARTVEINEKSAEDFEETAPGCGDADKLRTRVSDTSINEQGSSSRDEDDDPYEYDEDIPRRPPRLFGLENIDVEEIRRVANSEDSRGDSATGCSSAHEDILVASGASTASGITPCWGCKGCNLGTPFFILGSPADQPSACISCQ